MCIVYCITNLTNGKRYVGWTNKTLEQRWKKHVSNALIRKRRFLLSEAIRKYGLTNDVWKREVLTQVETPVEAKQLEVKFIADFDCCALTGGHGYNMKDGEVYTLPGLGVKDRVTCKTRHVKLGDQLLSFVERGFNATVVEIHGVQRTFDVVVRSRSCRST